MYPAIFEACHLDSQAQNIFGTSPFRFYPFGEAPPDVAKPYAVFQTVSGSPENCLDSVPDMDNFIIQVDVYDTTGSGVRSAAEALRDAIEPVAHITGWNPEGRDPITFNYRYRFTVDWWQPRT